MERHGLMMQNGQPGLTKMDKYDEMIEAERNYYEEDYLASLDPLHGDIEMQKRECWDMRRAGRWTRQMGTGEK
jgi:hypothetical protein